MLSHLRCGGSNPGWETARTDRQRGGVKAEGGGGGRRRRRGWEVIRIIAVECVGGSQGAHIASARSSSPRCLPQDKGQKREASPGATEGRERPCLSV